MGVEGRDGGQDAVEPRGTLDGLEKRASRLRTEAPDDDRAYKLWRDVRSLQAEALYAIAREALYNTVKHAAATSVELDLACSADRLTLEVRDNGAGFDPTASYPGHLGLHSMRERAAGVGATLTIDSSPGAGTRVRVELPLFPRAASRPAPGYC